jgi:lipopolysaccharide transport system permease protein
LVKWTNHLIPFIIPDSDVFASLIQHRSFILTHAVADLRRRYAGTSMGIVWNLIHPLAMMAIYVIIFTSFFGGRMAGIDSDYAYALYICSGFFPWIAWTECLGRGAVAFSSNAAYLRKLPIPEEIFVAQGAASAGLTLVISFALLMLASIPMGIAPAWTWVLIPIPLVLLLLCGLGLGMILGTLNVFFTDVAQLLGIALQVLFWLAPVILMREHLPAWLGSAMAFHPVTPALEAIRDVYLRGQLPAAWTWPAMAGWAAATLVGGTLVLRALRAEIRDVI